MSDRLTREELDRLRDWFTETTNWYGPPVLRLLDEVEQSRRRLDAAQLLLDQKQAALEQAEAERELS